MPLVLRRTASSPSVRVAPYSYSVSPSSSSSSARRRRRGTSDAGHPAFPRRQSSETAQPRRVLAEIDWWRVVEGQREPDENDINGEDDEDAGVDHGSGDDVGRVSRDPITPEPRSPRSLYPVRESPDDDEHLPHANTHAQDDFSYSSYYFPPSPAHSRSSSASYTTTEDIPFTPSSLPFTPAPRLTIFPRPAAPPPSLFFPSSPAPAPPLLTTFLAGAEDTTADVGVYTPAPPQARASRSRATSAPEMVDVSLRCDNGDPEPLEVQDDIYALGI